MKAAICLASLAILAGVITAAPFGWDPDTIYTYRTQCRYGAGMLGLEGPTVDNTQTDRAFIEVTYHLDIYQHEENKLYLNPRQFTAVIAQEQIDPREDPISSQKEVDIPEKYRKLLEKVMIVKLDPKSGVPESILVRANQPLTVAEKNIKRAQVQAFILNPGTSKLVVKGNVNRQTNSVRPSEQDDDAGFFYQVMEESIHGECQTYYSVSQTGPFQSLYQFEGQDVPVSDINNNNNADSNSQEQQQRPRSPKFAGSSQQSNEISEEGQQKTWPKAYDQFCKEGEQIYVIRKAVNLTACRDRPVLATVIPQELRECRPGDNTCKSLWDHVVYTRFLACGTSRQDFTIIEVNQEENFVYGTRVEENIEGRAIKNVTLLLKERTSANAAAEEMKNQGQQQYEIKSLVFEFDLEQQQEQLGGQQLRQPWQRKSSSRRHQSNSDSAEGPLGTYGPIQFPLQDQLPGLENPPLSAQLITNIVTQEQLEQHALYLVQEISHNIHDPKKSIAERETIALTTALSKTLRYLSQTQQINLYRTVSEQNSHDQELQVTATSVLADAMCASGTPASLVAVMKLIEDEQITDYRAAQNVMTFAQYARLPTKAFRERFWQFIKHPKVQRSQQIRTTALLAYSALLHESCVNARTKQSSYSYSLYGPLGQPEDVEPFVQDTIQKLEKLMQKREKDFKREQTSKAHEFSLYMAILGNVGHPSMLPIVQKVLDASNDVQEKSKALYALKHLIRPKDVNSPVQHSDGRVNVDENQNEVDRVEIDPVDYQVVQKKVVPLLMSVALDKTEHPTVRCIAIQMIVYSGADVTQWQMLAMNTWINDSEEVHYFTYTTMKNLAELQVAPTPLHKGMIIKARAVFPLCRPVNEQNASKSTNTFASGSVAALNAQFFRQMSWLGSRDSAWPTSFYFRNYLSFGSGALGVNPIEISLHFRTLQKVMDQVSATFGSSSSEESGEVNQYMKTILDTITKREMKENSHGSIYVNFRNGMQRLWQVDSLEKYLSWKSLSNYLSLRQGIPFNYQKTIQLAHHSMEFPTIFGLPMNVNVKLPTLFSLRGKARLNGNREDVQFHAEIDVVAGFKRHAKVSLKIPYIQKKIEAGLQTHVVVQAPFRVSYRQRSDEPIVFAITPAANINGTEPTGKIELLTFHRKPYVAIITDELYPTVSTQGGQMTIIRTIEPPTVSERHYPDVLGFAVSSKEVSDFRPENESPSAWSRFLALFKTPETFANFGSYGGQRVKYADRRVVLNVDASTSKTLLIVVAARRGPGSLDESFDTDLSSSSSSSSSTSESDESNSASREEQQNRLRQDQQSQSSSSSSSSSESNENSNSNEDSTEVLSKGRLVVVAILTKQKHLPAVPRTTAVVNLLKPEYPNQKQVVIQITKRTDKFQLRVAQGAAAEDSVRGLLTADSNSIKELAKAVIDPAYQGQQREFCAEISGKIVYPQYAHPNYLVTLRQVLLSRELKADVQGRIQFSDSCKDEDLKQNEIIISGELRRGQNMTEWARTKSPQAQKCAGDEAQEFSSSDDCLNVATQEAAALNKARLTIRWTENLPQPLQQAMYTGRDLLKARLMRHVYHNRFPQSPATGNSAIVNLRITPDSKFWFARILTNETELLINNVPSNRVIQAALPISALQTIGQNVQDAILGSDSQLTCQLEGRLISSFDNVVGQIQPEVAQGCRHLLAADGSGDNTMAIFATNVGTDNLKLQLILPQTRILLAGQQGVKRSQRAQTEPARDIVALVNGQVVSLPFTVRKPNQRPGSNDYVARIQPLPAGGVQVLTPKNDIFFDAQRVIIYADNIFRNQTVGMCGDCDGEKVADRRSRKDIPLSSATLLYADYAYEQIDGSHCTVNSEIKQQIKEEESLAKIRRGSGDSGSVSNLRWGRALFSRSKQQKAWQNRQVSSSSSSSSSSEEVQQQQAWGHQQQQTWGHQQQQTWEHQQQQQQQFHQQQQHVQQSGYRGNSNTRQG
ncbi:Vitellogenin [Orchesella cincta]|uniref:Vitellogenin n=1 Tax=Orchesella cincta TaxID=48709 RepID=A0A1D2M9A9_ORCCI|nr:Vitellogenin [Orchesella cincta]